MRFRVTLRGRLVSDSGESIDDAAREQVRAAFEKLNSLGAFPGNAAIFLTSSTGAIEIECGTEAADKLDAVKVAANQITEALRYAGIGVPTELPDANHPGWMVEWVLQSLDAELLEVA